MPGTPLPDVKAYIYVEETRYRAAVSEATMQKIGSDINFLLDNAVGLPGTITAWGGPSAPAGYLLCDGSPISRTTYANLFAAIGIAYGNPNGSQFNIPDFRGQFLRGVANGAGADPDRASRIASGAGGGSGDNVGSLQGWAMQSHNHELDTYPGNPGDPDFNVTGGDSSSYSISAINFTNNTGSAQTNPINIYVNYIIKY